MSAAASIDPCILEEAADWLVQMSAGELSPAQRSACEQWRARSAEHQRAWRRAERLIGRLDVLPPGLAMPALDRPGVNRRTVLRRLALLLAVAPAGWAGWRAAGQGGWTADFRTGVGERREWTLADGSRVTLNTASAIDVRFDDTQRRVVLRSGEIWIQTAPDAARRPFRVQTRDGHLQALGTRFTTRLHDDRTCVAVHEGAVRVEPRHPPGGAVAGDDATVIPSGFRTCFTERTVSVIEAADASGAAWVHGMLMADRMPLAELIGELARYRQGPLQVSPEVAALPVSGAFPVTETARALAMLEATYPVAVQARLHGYWLKVVSR